MLYIERNKPDNFEWHNSLKVNFTNIWGLCCNFVVCEPSHKSNSPDILALIGKLNWIAISLGRFYLSKFWFIGFY